MSDDNHSDYKAIRVGALLAVFLAGFFGRLGWELGGSWSSSFASLVGRVLP